MTRRKVGGGTQLWRLAAGTGLYVLLASGWSPAGAQTQKPRPPAPPARRPVAVQPDRGVRVRAFGEAGIRRFTAADTFDAVLGSSIGGLFGGGVDVVWGRHLSVEAGILRYHATGERVFVSGGEVFPLGIPDTVTVMPIMATVSYRFSQPRSQLIPFVGGGINWHRLTETSNLSVSADDVSSTFTGFHVQGGAEWRLTRHVGIAGVGRWSMVPDALGAEPSSAAAAFGEDDLGGFDATVRIVIGRR